MTELQKTNALLRDLIRTTYVQHQQLIWALEPDHMGSWINRFCLGYTLQKRHKIWSDEEYAIICKRDMPNGFKRWPELAKTWKVLRQYYPKDVRKFIDSFASIANTKKGKKKSKKK